MRLLLVDALNLIRRVYAAQAGEDGPQRAEDGRTGSQQSLGRALREAKPSHAVAVFEGAGSTWRHQIFPAYKSAHQPMPEALGVALPSYREAFAELGVPSFDSPGVEADDVIATLATKIAGAGGRALILSTDRFFLQLLSPSIAVRDHFGKRDLAAAYVRSKFGVPPPQLVDYLALTGDGSNDIPGVRGIGAKSAARLLAEISSVDELLAASLSSEKPATEPPSALTPALVAKLRAGEQSARLSLRLCRLRTDLELGLNLKSLRFVAAGQTP